MPLLEVQAINANVPQEIRQLDEWYDYNIGVKDLTLIEKQGITSLKKYFKTENTYISNMAKLREGLFKYTTTGIYEQDDKTKKIISFKNLSAEERELVNQYSKKLEQLLQAYLALQSHDPITQKKSSPGQVIQAIGNMMKTKEFETYNFCTKDLAIMQKKIGAITAFQNMKIDNQKFSDFNIMLVQHLPSFPIHFKPLVESLKEISSKSTVFPISSYQVSIGILETVTKFADATLIGVGNLDSAAVAIEQMKGIKTAELHSFAMRAILGLNFNNPLQPKPKTKIEIDFPDGYIKEILVKVYPNLFGYDGKKDLKIGGTSGQYINTSAALGMNLSELNSKFTFNPQKFDANKLDELYKEDNNPLWLVLKSTKPIDKDCTADQKIQVYIDLANLFEEKLIGAKNKFSSLINLAKAAFAVANMHPELISKVIESFGPNSKHGEWLTKNIAVLPKKDRSEPADIIMRLTNNVLLARAKELDQEKSQLSTPIVQLDLEKERNKAQTAQLASLQLEVHILTSKFGQQEEQIKNLTVQVAGAQQAAQKQEQSVRDMQALNDTLKIDLAKVKEELAGKSSEIVEKAKEIEQLKQQLASIPAQRVEIAATLKEQLIKQPSDIKPNICTDKQIDELISAVMKQHSQVSDRRMNVIGSFFASAKHLDIKDKYLKNIKLILDNSELASEQKLEGFTRLTETYMTKLAAGESVRYLKDLRDTLGMEESSKPDDYQTAWNAEQFDLKDVILKKIDSLSVEQLDEPGAIAQAN